jgi:hypothetical protein
MSWEIPPLEQMGPHASINPRLHAIGPFREWSEAVYPKFQFQDESKIFRRNRHANAIEGAGQIFVAQLAAI